MGIGLILFIFFSRFICFLKKIFSFSRSPDILKRRCRVSFRQDSRVPYITLLHKNCLALGPVQKKERLNFVSTKITVSLLDSIQQFFGVRQKMERTRFEWKMKMQGCIKLSKSKGLEMGKKIKSLKKRKKKIFEDLTLLIVPKGNIQLLQHNLTPFKPKIY